MSLSGSIFHTFVTCMWYKRICERHLTCAIRVGGERIVYLFQKSESKVFCIELVYSGLI